MISEKTLIKIFKKRFRGEYLSLKELSKEINHTFEELYPIIIKLKNRGIISFNEIKEIGRSLPIDIKITNFILPKKGLLLKHPFLIYIIYPLVVIFIAWIGKNTWERFHPAKHPETKLPSIEIEKVEGDFVAGNKNVFELKKTDSIIRTLELQVTMDIFAPEGENIEEGTSVGLSSVVGLFSSEKTRYRFITDYKFSVSKAGLNKQKLTLIYQPESPDQIIGKKIDFLRNMELLVINYSDFLKTIKLKIDKEKPIGFNLDIVLNGIKVVSLSENVLASTICNGQAQMRVQQYFKDIDKAYSEISSK